MSDADLNSGSAGSPRVSQRVRVLLVHFGEDIKIRSSPYADFKSLNLARHPALSVHQDHIDAPLAILAEIRDLEPQILIIGQTILAESIVQELSVGEPASPLVMRWSRFYDSERAPYTHRSADELGYHLDMPKTAEAIATVLEATEFLEGVRAEDSRRVHNSLPKGVLSLHQDLTWPAPSSSPRIHFHESQFGPTESEYFDVCISDDRALIRLFGYWMDRNSFAGGYGSLRHIIGELMKERETEYIIDLTSAAGFSTKMLRTVSFSPFTGWELRQASDHGIATSVENGRVRHSGSAGKYSFHFQYREDTPIFPSGSAGVLQRFGTRLEKPINYSGLSLHRVATYTNKIDAGRIVSDQREIGNALALAFHLSEGRVRITPLQTHDLFLALLDPGHNEDVIVARPYALARRTGTVLAEEINELEWLLNRASTEELDLQRFFEQHPSVLLGNTHARVFPHLVLHRDEGSLIPDFMVEPLVGGLLDLVELKHPQKKVWTSVNTNRPRFTAAVLEGIAQLRTYADWFEDKSNRDAFESAYGLAAYRPHAVLVIGRHDDRIDLITRKKIQADSPNVTVYTYDDLLELGRKRLLL